MPKARKRRYTKRYRRYKRVSENYFRVRAEVDGLISYPVNGGQPVFTLTNDANNPISVLTFQKILQHQTFSVMLLGMFSFYKLLGISIEVTPQAQNSAGYKAIDKEPMTIVAVRAGDSTAMNFAEAKSINSGIVLNPIQFVRKYTSLLGFYNSYIATDSAFSGAVTVVAENDTGQLANSPTWVFKITQYILYKKSKV